MGALNDSDVLIGKVLGPFGNRGEIKIEVLTDFEERYSVGRVLNFVLPNDNRVTFRLRSFKKHKNVCLAALEGVSDRTQAEAMRGSDIVIGVNEVQPLPEGSYYIFDLIGCNVLTDDGRDLGTVTKILQPGSNDVYITSSGVCVPALKEVVLSIDKDAKRILIHPMPGMFAD